MREREREEEEREGERMEKRARERERYYRCCIAARGASSNKTIMWQPRGGSIKLRRSPPYVALMRQHAQRAACGSARIGSVCEYILLYSRRCQRQHRRCCQRDAVVFSLRSTRCNVDLVVVNAMQWCCQRDALMRQPYVSACKTLMWQHAYPFANTLAVVDEMH